MTETLTFKELINTVFITGIIQPLIALSFGVALLVFLWGVVKYIKNSGDEKTREEAKYYMLYGVVGLFVMVSVWGLVRFLIVSIGLNNNTPTPPTNLISNPPTE